MPIRTKPDDEKVRSCTKVQPGIFYGSKGRRDLARMAKTVCLGCPVKDACLEGALERNERFGTWGAMSARERQDERKTRGMTGTRPLLSRTA